jgi:ATP sulfurylase
LSEPYYDVIRPHGGILVNRVLRGEVKEAVRERAAGMLSICLGRTNLSDLELIATGAYSPLSGFMGRADYERCVNEMRLANGLVWSVPVTLAVEQEVAGAIEEGQEIALCEGERILAVMEVTEKFPYDRKTKEQEAREVYRTSEEVHPGVARIYRQGDVLLGGEIWLVDWPGAAKTEFPNLRHTPAETRRMFARRGWRSVVGFQTRNPIHRAHEYIQKTALEIVDGLFLHPLVGETKKDDIPADVRIASYETILRDYYPADRVLLGVFPAAMRYAGPREAIFHAIARKNYGCTHFIVGRDHAGVGKYYGTYDAQNIFDQFAPEEIGIIPFKFEHAFYCKKCAAIVSAKTCPHGREDWLYLSGTQVREMLERGEMLPEEFTRPEVARVLVEGVQRQIRKVSEES